MAAKKRGTKRATPKPDKSSRQALDCLDNVYKKAKQASGAESETDTVIEDPDGSSMDNSVSSVPPAGKHRLEIPQHVANMVKERTMPSRIGMLLSTSDSCFEKHLKHVANKVEERLEAFITEREKSASPGRLTRMLSVSGLMDSLQLSHESVSPYEPLMKLARQRSNDKENNPPAFAQESEVYESIQALMAFINDNAASVVAPATSPAPEIAFDDDNDDNNDTKDASADLPQPRRFSYYMGDFPIPEDSKPDMWMNMALMLPDSTPPLESKVEDTSLEQPNHRHIFSIVEARCSVAEEKDALEHMTAFSERLFTCRPDRKFAWGFVVCDSVVCACVIMLNFVKIAEPMNISTAEGRRRFVSMVVSMAFVENMHLGYDPTVRYVHDKNQWEIDVLDSKSKEKHTYRVVKQIGQGGLTHNNLRTFQCTRYRGLDSDTSDAEDKEYVFVKDVWSPELGYRFDKYRNEVNLTRKVSETLRCDNQLNGTYPTLLSGGDVRSHSDFSDEKILDMTLSSLSRQAEYVHNRLAMTPFASPINQLKSVDELIVVAADAMTAYMAVAQKCDILHRDISKNNIMFTRQEDGSVRGLLIDFDNAIKDPVFGKENIDFIGTGRYMSIRTLEESKIRRTTLDDWESMFYVLCWEATFGLKRERHDTPQDLLDMIQIFEWQTDNPKVAAQFKRGHMDSLRSFSSLIAGYFYQADEYEHMKALLTEMYLCIFQNKNMTVLGRGALKLEPSDLQALQTEVCQCESDDKETYDSYRADLDYTAIDRRSDCSDKITSELLEIIQRARVDALERIKLAEDSD
ncbi:hypothetical protein LPJ53_002510 [Coemansia erecta]|uniref:Protein kinase domain-containing protein n=1 Tax=Coemansia erecta TaxID=147472 RepID=A0A9W8CSZ5_9FUNG|nr:hypothetical protein LPJ53_002510 [Coemansia erecta]